MKKARMAVETRKDVTDTDGFEQLYLTVEQPVSESSDNAALARPEQHMFLRPYFLLDKHADKNIGFETREIVMLNGKKIERRWCVRPDEEYGMPGPIERDVLLAVYEIAYENYLSKGAMVPELMLCSVLSASSSSCLKRQKLRLRAPSSRAPLAAFLDIARVFFAQWEPAWF